jgi:integrase
MAGSIRQRKDRGANTWELSVFIGRDNHGCPKQRSVVFRGGKRAAERELARLIAVQDSTPAPIPEEENRAWGPSTTINDAIEGWKDNGWADLSPKTVRGYEEIWGRYVRETIGTKRIAALNAFEVERYFRKMKADGAGRDTVRRVRNIIGRTCRLAAKWSGGTLTNPVTDTELPTRPLAERPDPVRAPEVVEVQALVREAKDFDERFGAYLHLVAATGTRRGEACALRWSNIDWEGETVRVNESIVAAKGGAVAKGPKTKASIRTVAVDTGTIAVLEALRSSQTQLAKICELALSEDGFVFSTEPGGEIPPHPESMTHTFIKVRKRAGVAADVHLHSLRHFQATILETSDVALGASFDALCDRCPIRHLGSREVGIAAEDRRAAEHVGRVLDNEGEGESNDAPQDGQQELALDVPTAAS